MSNWARCPSCKEDTIYVYICRDICLPTQCDKCGAKITAIIKHTADAPATWWIELVTQPKGDEFFIRKATS